MRILSQAQAKAVYDAMCAINNVGTIWLLKIDTPEFSAKETVTGGIMLCDDDGGRETYLNQAEFAAAYGFN